MKEKLKHVKHEAKRIIDFSFKVIGEIYSFIFSGLFLILCLIIGLLPVAVVIALVVKFMIWLF